MIDLHTHSWHSDGSLSPTELVTQAAAAGITQLALTDHDCLSGLSEAHAQAQTSGIHLIDGVELSVTWQGKTLHILGLGIDPNHAPFQQCIDDALAMRQARALQMSTLLAQRGIEGVYEGVSALARSKSLGRGHFAKFLVQQGYAKDHRQVFKRYLVPGKPGYIAAQWIAMQAGVEAIKQAGGVAVIAHPARYKLSRTKLVRLLDSFKEAGGEAIEVISGSHGPHEASAMAQHARDFDLAASVGSDFHGPEQQWLRLGRLAPLPSACRGVWELLNLPALAASRRKSRRCKS